MEIVKDRDRLKETAEVGHLFKITFLATNLVLRYRILIRVKHVYKNKIHLLHVL
jgi:hypothetical protein